MRNTEKICVLADLPGEFLQQLLKNAEKMGSTLGAIFEK